MTGYCTSWQIYFREPKASENTAHKYNVQPYSTFTSVIMCLLPTFSALISFTNSHMRTCIIWRHAKYRLVSVATTKPCQLPIPCVRTLYTAPPVGQTSRLERFTSSEM